MQNMSEDLDNESSADIEEVKPASFFVSIFFGIAFTAIGGVLAYLIFQNVFEESQSLVGLSMLSLTCIIFSLIGIMILYGVLTWSKSVAEFSLVTSLQEEWNKGLIKCSAKPKFLAFSLLFLILLLSALPATYVAYTELQADKLDNVWWFGALLLLLVPLFFVLKHGLQFFRYGESTCHLPKGPGRIGGELKVVCATTKRIEAIADFKARLSCTTVRIIETQTGRQVETKTIWEQEQLAPYQSNHSAHGITFDFKIAGDLPASDAAGAHAKTKWQLEFQAPTKGLDFKAHFHVPVIS